MLNMPASDMKKKIHEQAGLSLQEIETKIAEKMKQLSGLISEEGACHIIANELSVDLIPKAENRKISDLLAGMRDVKQNMRVVQVYEMRSFQSKFDGGEGKVCSFLGGDESGVIRATCWGEHAETASKLKPGDIVRVQNAYVKENNGRAELHLNDKSQLEVNPAGVSVESSAKREESGEYERRTIKDISRGDYRVELLGTIVQAYEPRFFDRKDGSGRGAVMNMLIDDGTGNMRCALWGAAAAGALGIDEKTLVENGEQPYNEERTALLGTIVSVKGRAKLNSQYNTIEMSVDEINLKPNPEEELSRMNGEKASVTNVPDAINQPEDAVSLPKKKDAPRLAKKETPPPPVEDDDAVSLDDLDDLDDL